jgi:AraC family transcriptional regulator
MPRGKAEVPGGARHIVGMHFGRPVQATCAVGDQRVRGLQKPGDIDFIPAGFDGSWEDDADCHILRIGLDPSVLAQAAEDLGRSPESIDLRPSLQLRDAGIEAILTAVKADLEASIPSDPLYIDHLSHALAMRLLATVTAGEPPNAHTNGSTVLRPEVSRVIDYIEINLDKRMHLVELAMIAGLSLTRLKIAFRDTTGRPLHQYVIRRRVESARDLIATTTMPMSQIAIAAGFAHQSHMATTMRRIIGVTPSEITRPRSSPCPNLHKIGLNVREKAVVAL